MQLKVEKLQSTITDAIERARQEQIEWDKNVDAAEAEYNRRWREIELPKLKPLRDLLTQRLKDKKPITRAEIEPFIFFPSAYSDDRPRGYLRPFNRGHYSGHNKTWKASHNYGPRPVLQIDAFETLRDFLEVVAEETVSTSQLANLGFRNMSKLFDAAANGYFQDKA
ncbi:hypothetical protein SEA_SKOG_198 [Gordonia phage Skog]|uniref:Uncharacterized protein n=1 Tax=Gordonia phage Skog TaxID=2704033 RepID=A0A6G6XKR2_9CAUD|nr:hypothetical protein KHQ85_gp198 [Gordonia phage Skog]QIG58350.1 hypothetical protein SEA_SKOG_198 [Gordonia phage Skog]